MSGPLDSMKRKLHGLLARGVVLMTTATTKMQGLQLALLDDETSDGVEHFEPYGYTSRPHAGAEAIALHLGGDRAHCIAVVVADRRYRLQGLQDGEVALYTDEGDSIVLKRGNRIAITTQILEVNASQSNFSGNISATGDVTAGGISLRGHVHPENDNGGPTGAPVGGA